MVLLSDATLPPRGHGVPDGCGDRGSDAGWSGVERGSVVAAMASNLLFICRTSVGCDGTRFDLSGLGRAELATYCAVRCGAVRCGIGICVRS